MIQRLLNWLRGQIAYYVMRAGTLALNKPLGLSVTTTSHLDDLYQKSYEFAYAVHQQQRAEAELEECQIEVDALKVKVALLNLRYEAEAIGYEVHYLNMDEGETFTLVAQDDSVTFPQTLDDISYALEIVMHDAVEMAKSEVQA